MNRIPQERLASVVQRIREVRDRSGWRPTTWQPASFSSRCMGVLRELDEFEEAILNPDPFFMLELADVSMYLLMILHDLGGHPSGSLPPVQPPHGESQTGVILEMTRQARSRVLHAWNQWRRSSFSHDDVLSDLRMAFAIINTVAEVCQMPLEKAILEKCRINETRGPTHGGKHPDT